MEAKNVPFSSANLHQKISGKVVFFGLLFTLGLLAVFSSFQYGWPFSLASVTQGATAAVASVAPQVEQATSSMNITLTGPASRGWKFGSWSKDGRRVTGTATFNPLPVERLLNAETGSIMYTAYQVSDGSRIKLQEASVSIPSLSAGETGRVEFYVPKETNAIVLTMDYAEPGAQLAASRYQATVAGTAAALLTGGPGGRRRSSRVVR